MVQDIKLLVEKTKQALISEFHKTEDDAQDLIECSKMKKYLEKNPIGLHRSGYDWAVTILVENRDIEALEKYLK